jgi:hypothetical protein
MLDSKEAQYSTYVLGILLASLEKWYKPKGIKYDQHSL